MVGVNREILGGEMHVVSQRGSARRDLPSLTVRGSSPGPADGEEAGSASELASVPGSAVFGPAGLSTLTACLEVLRLAAGADPEARRLEDSGLEAEIQAWVGSRGAGDDEGKAAGEAEGEELAGRAKFATEEETETGAGTRVAYECRALIRRGLGHLAELAAARDSSRVDGSAAREIDAAEEGSPARKQRSDDVQSEAVCSDAWERRLRARLSGDEESQKRRSQRPSQRPSQRRLSRFHAPLDDLKGQAGHTGTRRLLSGDEETQKRRSHRPSQRRLSRFHAPPDDPKGQAGRTRYLFPKVFTNPRFLVLAFAMEQTSNARAHLLEAARLARLTGRVLVLPHVGSGRLSVGRQHPLCSYWDLSRLTHSSSSPHSSSSAQSTHPPFNSSSLPPSPLPWPLPSHLPVEWVSPDLFLLLARSSLPAAPSVGFVCVETPSLNRPCFDFGEVASGLGAILTYSLGQLPTRANTQVITVRKASRFLTAFQKWQHTDVVVWVKTTYKRMAIRPPTSLLVPVLLPYHPRWHTLARSIASALPHPFIALHLRSEYIAWLVCSLSHPFIALHFRSKYMAWLECSLSHPFIALHFRSEYMAWLECSLSHPFIALHFRSEYMAWLETQGGKLQQEQKIGKQMHWCAAEESC
ncbi:unnamed protein product [Closterium sp. NIES-65]|nr:unnamed protein product [Closterium sp. NIES-65]